MRASPGVVVPLVFALALVACGGGKDGGGGAGGGDDTGTANHPIAPDTYEGDWDIESLGCDDATVYWAFTGSIDADGRLAGEETWYWFFAEEGWDADCADTFDLDAVEEPTPIEDDPCLSCDRDFTASYVLNEDKRGCNIDGYESLLDNDTRDRIDEESYTLAIMLDTNPLGGDEGDVNVWSYAQDDVSETTWNDRGIGLGTFTPETAGDVAGPGTLTWARQDGLCVTIEEG
jgi:hypothetical protein